MKPALLNRRLSLAFSALLVLLASTLWLPSERPAYSQAQTAAQTANKLELMTPMRDGVFGGSVRDIRSDSRCGELTNGAETSATAASDTTTAKRRAALQNIVLMFGWVVRRLMRILGQLTELFPLRQ